MRWRGRAGGEAIRKQQAASRRPAPRPAPPRRAPPAATAPARRSPCRSGPAATARGAPARAPDGSAPPTRRSAGVTSSSAQAKSRPRAYSTTWRVFQCRLKYSSRVSCAGVGGCHSTTGSCGRPRRGAMSWFAPCSQAVAHTSSPGSAASRPPRSMPRSSSSAPKGNTTPSTSRNSSGALIPTTVCQCPQNASACGRSRHCALPCAMRGLPRAPQRPLVHAAFPLLYRALL